MKERFSHSSFFFYFEDFHFHHIVWSIIIHTASQPASLARYLKNKDVNTYSMDSMDSVDSVYDDDGGGGGVCRHQSMIDCGEKPTKKQKKRKKETFFLFT